MKPLNQNGCFDSGINCPRTEKTDLLHLGWGRYGERPLVSTKGWSYLFVSKGARMLRLAKGVVRMPPEQLIIVDPSCGCELSNDKTEKSELLAWLWANGPCCEECVPPPGGFRLFLVDGSLRQKLKQIHVVCRNAVEHPDKLTETELKIAHMQLDLAIARAQSPRLNPPEMDLRLQFSLRWLSQNLDEPKPVAVLCDYLQISQVTLNRLFRTQLRESVATYYHRLKMQRAQEWLSTGHVAVKEVSFALGYKHSNDFTRAFTRFNGRSPRKHQTVPE